MTTTIPELKTFEASLVLSAVGDALGFKNGSWEFNKRGTKIHKEAEALGGVEKITVGRGFPVSDDTVMHLATAKALINWGGDSPLQSLYPEICTQYVICWSDMDGRAPGIQCATAMPKLKKGEWDKVPYSNAGGGCGAAMRTMCIGLVFPSPEQEKLLIASSIEAGRMTHNHPTGFLGGVVAALFTAYAVRGLPVVEWGRKFLKEAYPECINYLKTSGAFWADYSAEPARLGYFKDQWTKYLDLRQISQDGQNSPVFPAEYGVEERDTFYTSISWSGWGGSSGHDSVIIAYDALLGSGGNWIEFCKRGVLHGGDNDSTGAIAGAWFGVLHGFNGVPENHFEDIEKLEELRKCSAKLHQLAQKLRQVNHSSLLS